MGGQIVLFAHNAIDVIAQAKRKRQPWSDFPFVLNVEAIRILREVPVRIPEISQRGIGLTEQKFLDLMYWVGIRGNRELDPSLVMAEIRIRVLKIAAYRNVVVASNPGEMFRPIDGLVGAGTYRVIQSPAPSDAGKKIRHIHVWHAQILRGREWACIDTQALRINTVVCLNDLRKSRQT